MRWHEHNYLSSKHDGGIRTLWQKRIAEEKLLTSRPSTRDKSKSFAFRDDLSQPWLSTIGWCPVFRMIACSIVGVGLAQATAYVRVVAIGLVLGKVLAWLLFYYRMHDLLELGLGHFWGEMVRVLQIQHSSFRFCTRSPPRQRNVM